MADPLEELEQALGGKVVSKSGRDPLDILQTQLEQPYSGGAAFSGGFTRGIPIVGPALESGAQSAAAHIRSLQSGRPVEEERQTVEDFAKRSTAGNPTLSTTGELAGGVTAMAPLGAFGV